MTRDLKLVALFAGLAVIASMAVGAHVSSARPHVEVVSSRVPVAPGQPLSVMFLGDTMLADGAQPDLDKHGYDWPLRHVRDLLEGDFAIANAEAPISPRTRPADPVKEYSYSSSPVAAAALARAGVDALGLANNHSLDVGAIGLGDTIAAARSSSIATFGAGRDSRRADRPLLLRSSAGTIGVVGIGEDFGDRSSAAVGHPGTAVLSPSAVQRGVDVARAAGADWVVAYVHWGDNYQPVVPQQRAWAAQLAAAGYDMVIGTGPHIVQPIRVVAGIPVAYSIGNFVFGSPGRFASYGTQGFGLALRLELRRGHPPRVTTTCLQTDNSRIDYQPRRCSGTQAAELYPTVSPDLVRTGPATADLRCSCLQGSRRR